MSVKHETTHAESAEPDGAVQVWCMKRGCGWRVAVMVAGLTWVDAMAAIFASRDAHEESANAAVRR